MDRSWMKWGALGCCGLAFLLFLFTPFYSAFGYGASGADMAFQAGEITAILSMIILVVMIIAVLAAKGKTAGIICCIGAVLPLLMTLIRSSSAYGLASPGAGVYLVLLLGGGAATLCFLSGGRGYKPYQDQYNNQYNDRNNNQSGGNQW